MQIRDFIFTTGRRLRKSAARWWQSGHADTAASLAFYSLISMVPILMTGVYVAAWIVGDRASVQESLIEGTNSFAGRTVADFFKNLLSADVNWVGSNISPIVGAVFMLYAATKVIAELRKTFGQIFGNTYEHKRAAIAKVVNRLVSLVLLLLLGGFIACAVVVETIIAVVVGSLKESSFLLQIIPFIVPILTFVAITFLSTVAMHLLARRPPSYRIALHGGIVSAVLLLLLKFGLTLFLNYATIGDFYGSALTLVVVLFWVYFAMQAFLFSAEYAAEVAREMRIMGLDEDAEVPLIVPESVIFPTKAITSEAEEITTSAEAISEIKVATSAPKKDSETDDVNKVLSNEK